MKGYQMAKKKEPKYIGRYGEVLEDVEFIDDKPDFDGRLMLKGFGVDKNGIKSEVVFQVSARTGKKDGRYFIRRKNENGKEADTEESRYENGVLNGRESYHHYVYLPWYNHITTFETNWYTEEVLKNSRKEQK